MQSKIVVNDIASSDMGKAKTNPYVLTSSITIYTLGSLVHMPQNETKLLIIHLYT
jgi:hypothetical protein